MELDDRLLRDMKRNEQAAQRDAYYADEPDWMIYGKREREVPLNEYRGVFETKDETSINTAPSVFEKGTIFHTGKTGSAG
jgi:hypothetical protein